MKAVFADADLHRDVLEELEFDPEVPTSKLGIAAENGIITLTGTVQTFPQKWAAERAVKRVRGVRGIANELRVQLMGMHTPDDTDLAETVAQVLSWDPAIPKGIQVEVSDGTVTLTGTVDWNYQRALAEKHVRHIKGVRSVLNAVHLRDLALPSDVKERIRAALGRMPDFDRDVSIVVSNHRIELRGTVRSWPERESAERAAWSIPGVSHVVNELIISE